MIDADLVYGKTKPIINKRGLKEYPKDYNPILEYWEQIETGKTIVCDKVYRTYKKIVYDLTDKTSEFFYSPARANHVIEFAENYCRHSKGKWGGKPVILELWEKAMLATIFGFIDIEGNRKYQEAILIIGKKNGKSLLASIVGLYLLIGDGEAGPEIYAVASKRDQAKIIWQEAKRMVRKSPALAKRIKTLVAELNSELHNDGVFKPLASDSDTLDGLNIHGALMDEFHQWKNGRPLYNIIADGTSAREQPLNFMTSTAGTIREDIYDEVYDEATMIINGYFDDNGYKDERKIAFIYELDNRKEWTDPKMWRKANPGLGTIKNLRTLTEKVERAKKNPALVKNLVCKEFNIRETSTEAWLTFEQLNNPATYDLEKLKPRYCVAGIDLGATTDLTCATIIFRVPDDEILYVKQMYWLPGDLLDKRVKEDKIPYDIWLDQGLLRISEGNKVNYKDVTEWLLEVQNEMDIYIYKIGYDSWGSTYFIDELEQNFGKITEPVIQGAKTFSNPLKRVAVELESKKINYGNSPIFKWNLSNSAISVDRNDNIALVKTSNPRRRIDGVASFMDAFIVYERHYNDYMNII
jgi:phage terminase large subunit-like protein